MQSHKRPVIEAGLAAGCEVWVASRGPAPDISQIPNVTHIPLRWSRTGSVPGAAVRALPECFRLSNLLSRVRPDILHNFALKPCVLGSLAALGRPTTVVNSINGLGYLFLSDALSARLARPAISASLRAAEHIQNAVTVFQNEEDAGAGTNILGLGRDQIKIIAGSGVDVSAYTPQAEPAQGPIRFAILSRMIAQKGIAIAVEAVRQCRSRGHDVELVLCGAPDPGNPTSLSIEQLKSWDKRPEVTWMGQVADVRTVLSSVHAVIQPSLGGEGLPKALLEAAAMARPLIATDVPGNRSVVVPDQTGLLVPPGETTALCEALVELVVRGEDKRKQMGAQARARVCDLFSSERVRDAHEALYRGLLRP